MRVARHHGDGRERGGDRAEAVEASVLGFGPVGAGHVDLGAIALALVVPLLTVPQGTHYVLDGLIWRRGDTRTRPSQRAALGFLP